MASVWGELKRRNVVKVAIAYAAVAWLVIQIVNDVFPHIGLEDWRSPIIVLIIIGFPFAVVFAWAYELTPEGLKPSKDVHPAASIAKSTGQRLNRITLVVLALAVAFLFYDRLDNSPSTVSAPATEAVDPDKVVQRFTIELGKTVPLQFGNSPTRILDADIAISPDGSLVVYSADPDGSGLRLFKRNLNAFDNEEIPGTEGGRQPFFSPDGAWLGFAVPAEGIKKVSLHGGPPESIFAGSELFMGPAGAPYSGFTWTNDDDIIASFAGSSDRSRGLLVRLPARAGARPVLLVEPEKGMSYTYPDLLPGNSTLLFTIRADNEPASAGTLALLDLDSGDIRPILRNAFNARFVNTGHIVFARSQALWAAPFDLDNLAITGTPVPVVDGVQMHSIRGRVAYGFSNDGLLAYVRGSETGNPESGTWIPVQVDRGGREEELSTDANHFSFPSISPDGAHVAMTIRSTISNREVSDIWMYNFRRGTLAKVTNTGSAGRTVWTRDGIWLLFQNEKDATLWRVRADGTSEPENISGHLRIRPRVVTPDGKQLVFTNADNQTVDGFAPYLSEIDNLDTSAPLDLNGTAVNAMDLSPDGRWLAYVSEETGNRQIYVRPFPDVESNKWPISIEFGDEPLWSNDGREIYFRWPTVGVVFSVSVEIHGDKIEPGIPQALFSGNYAGGFDRPTWDIGPDGRFVMFKSTEPPVEQQAESTSLALVRNWFEELKQLAPPSEAL